MDFEPVSAINPYITGVPVPPERFYGYASQVKQFYQAMRGSILQPVRVLGLRRSGKTSFLGYISSDQGKNAGLNSPVFNDLKLIYVELQMVQTPTQFYIRVANAIWGKVRHPDCLPGDIPNGYLFEQWIGKFFDVVGKCKLVILLDEFDKLASKSEFDADFFGLLRSLACNSDFSGRLTWVTASVKDLHALSLQKGDTDKMSPLWNIFLPTPIILGGFDRQEANELILKPALSQNVIFSKKAICEIHRIAGKLPYFIQAVASEWYEAELQRKSFKIIARQTLDDLVNNELILKIFAGYWRQLSEKQQDFLYHLALEKHTMIPIARQDYLPLCDFGLVEKTSSGDKIAGELFRQFIILNSPRISEYLDEEIDSGASQGSQSDNNAGSKTVNINIYGDPDINRLNLFSIESPDIDEIFRTLYEKVDSLADEKTKKQVEEAIKGLKAEACKGEKANQKAINKWFIFLAKMAPDIFEVVVATFINPIKGLSTAFKKIAEQASKPK